MPYPSKLSLDAIADVAVALVREKGLGELGVRAVAEQLEVRPSALYRHCGDGLGLIALVAEAGARRLRLRTERALKADADRLQAMATAYRTFARDEAALYAALTTDTTASQWQQQPGSERKQLWTLLLQEVGRVTGNADDTAAAVALWSFLHGYVALDNARLFGASGPQGGFDVGMAALSAGLAHRHATLSSHHQHDAGPAASAKARG